MRRVEYEEYGEPDVLKVVAVAEPRLSKGDQVLVQVAASSINAIDWKNRQGRFRLVSGLIRPRTRQGFDLVGRVVEVGGEVSRLQPGDWVIGLLGNLVGGAFAERVVASENQLTKVNRNGDIHSLAGMPLAASTAWIALFEKGDLKPAKRVLVNGGSSGVGSYAIQIARAHGAEVTAVCSSANGEFCEELGAHRVIDYAVGDFVRSDSTYDIIFDVVNNRSLREVKRILAMEGNYIGTIPVPRLIREIMTSPRAHFVAVRPDKNVLACLVQLYEQGTLRTPVDRVYGLSEIVDAHRYAERSRTRGKVIIEI